MPESASDLQHEVSRLRALVEALTAELAETNQGVLALYAELDDNAVRLREASDLKSRFLSYMSHEFRTPLSSIQSITRLLQDRLDGPLTDEQQKQVRFIQTAAFELTEMVNDLLDLAKVEAGRVTISPAWFEMVDLFSALRGMFKPILQSDDVSLIFEEPQDVRQIYTDHKKLSQILRNFISNALKFTPRGEVRVSALLTGDRVIFSVTDTGIGIAPEHLPALFQDFVQVDAPIQKRLRGMFKPILQSHSVSLVFEEPQDVPRIFTDDKKLSQILRNFISNALKFTPNGEVRVSATLVDGDRVTFAVADTGIGIAAEHVGSLFNDFVQIDAPIQKRLRGTGLGLSLSRKLALLLGGDVAVESTLGQGSRFSVTLPVRVPMAETGDGTAGVTAANG